MKNILLIIPTSQGTIPRVSYNIYNALEKEKGVNIYVANLSPNHESIYPPNIEFRCNHNFSNLSKAIFLYRLKKRLNIDISISTLLGCNALNVFSKRKDKTIGIFHAPLEQTKKLGLFTYIKCLVSYKLIFNKLDYLFAVSQSVKDDLSRYISKEIKVVYNIHDFDTIKLLSNENLTLEENRIFNKPTILCVGNLLVSKGINRLLTSFSKFCRHNGYDTNLVFIGADKNKCIPHIFMEYANELGIVNNTFFLGYQNNPYKYMKRCSILISPSFSEGLPGVLIEALSLGKQVVSTNSSKGVWEILQIIDLYNENLDQIITTKLGYITPNLSNNEERNICMLAECISRIDFSKNIKDEDFMKERFSRHSIAKQFLLSST